jgi:hypothetical protein
MPCYGISCMNPFVNFMTDKCKFHAIFLACIQLYEHRLTHPNWRPPSQFSCDKCYTI